MSKVSRFLKHDHWAAADGKRDVGPFFLRFRTPILEGHETEDFEHQLLIVWPYADEDTGELPSDEDQAQMHAFEERLRQAWEYDGLAVLTAVLTFDGARQWVFYTRNVDECGERLCAMPHEAEPYPIELTTEPDPTWSYLRDQILQTVDWRKHQEEWKSEL
jgi:hypothetical protein